MLRLLRFQSSAALYECKQICTTVTSSGTTVPRTAKTLQQQYNANKLYQDGRTRLYRSPQNVGFTLSCYTLGFACFASVTYMGFVEMWKEVPGSGLPWFVPVSYRLSMVFLGFLGWWVVLQSRGQVKALDLVWRNGKAQMLVTMRKNFPNRFIQPRQFVEDVTNISLPLRVISEGDLVLEEAKDERTPVTQRLRGLLLNFFLGMRRIFTRDGFIITTINNEWGYKIDAYGSFQNNGRDLLAVASQEIA